MPTDKTLTTEELDQLAELAGGLRQRGLDGDKVYADGIQAILDNHRPKADTAGERARVSRWRDAPSAGVRGRKGWPADLRRARRGGGPQGARRTATWGAKPKERGRLREPEPKSPKGVGQPRLEAKGLHVSPGQRPGAEDAQRGGTAKGRSGVVVQRTERKAPTVGPHRTAQRACAKRLGSRGRWGEAPKTGPAPGFKDR